MEDVSTAPEAPAVEQTPAPAPVRQGPQQEPEAHAQPPEPKPQRSARDAVAKALRDAEADDPAPREAKTEAQEPKADKTPEAPKAETPKAETKPTEKLAPAEGERERNEKGQFVAKEPAEGDPKAETPKEAAKPASEPPSRWTPEAKAAWAEAPEAVRNEVSRTVTELETGLQQYQQAFEPLKQYDQYARRHNLPLQGMLEKFVAANEQLNTDFPGAIRTLAAQFGKSPEDVAFALLDGPDEQPGAQPQMDPAVQRELQELRQFREQSQQREQQRASEEVANRVNAFAAQHPDFDELSPDIAWYMKTGRTNDLEEAYRLAKRDRAPTPPPQPAPEPQQPAAPAARAQTPAANLSVTGAPSGGSNPRAGSTGSARGDVQRALSRVGVR